MKRRRLCRAVVGAGIGLGVAMSVVWAQEPCEWRLNTDIGRISCSGHEVGGNSDVSCVGVASLGGLAQPLTLTATATDAEGTEYATCTALLTPNQGGVRTAGCIVRCEAP